MDYVAVPQRRTNGPASRFRATVWNAQPEISFASGGQACLGHRESGQDDEPTPETRSVHSESEYSTDAYAAAFRQLQIAPITCGCSRRITTRPISH